MHKRCWDLRIATARNHSILSEAFRILDEKRAEVAKWLLPISGTMSRTSSILPWPTETPPLSGLCLALSTAAQCDPTFTLVLTTTVWQCAAYFSPFLQCKQTPLDVRIMLNRESKVRVGRWCVWYPLCIICQISMTSWHDHCFGIPTLRVLQRTRITASQLSSTPGCNLERPQKSKRVRKDNFHKGWL